VQWTRDRRASAAQLSAEAVRARISVAHLEETRDTLAVRNVRYLALAVHLLEQQTPAGAGGSLASILSDVAASSNVRVGSVQIRADTANVGAFIRVTVRAELTGDIRGLAELLSAIEQSQTLLAVRALSISQPELGAGDERAEVLRAELVLEGLMPSTRGRRSR
jgi:hypothetical protein